MTERLYCHIQRSPLHWLLSVPGIAMVVAAMFVPAHVRVAAIALSASGCLILLAAMSFGHLKVSGFEDRIEARFGPLPFLGTTVMYCDIVSVAASRSGFLDGWGVHYLPGRGWIYNLWGFDCVELTLRNSGKIRIGTDDCRNLVAFLQNRLQSQPSSD
jgi:hypothetical protein